MRATLVRCLSMTLCCLAATGCAAKAFQEAKVAKVAPADKNNTPSTWTVQGWGKAEAAAKEHALRNAREMVIAHLRSLQPPLAWTPSVEDVRKYLQFSQWRSCPDQDTVVEGEPMHCFSWTAQLLPFQLDAMRRDDAKYRAQLAVQERSAIAAERMLGMGKLVGGLVLTLAAVWLYARVAQTARRKTATD